jgi:hypothetical protein
MLVEVLNVAAQNTGLAGLANKGGIVAELQINQQTRIAVCTAHLEAHEGKQKYQIRYSTMGDIFDGTKGSCAQDMSIHSHYTFVLGDLNFRTELPEEEFESEEDHRAKVRMLAELKAWDRLNEIDELQKAMRQSDVLHGFQTLFCNHPPTFK